MQTDILYEKSPSHQTVSFVDNQRSRPYLLLPALQSELIRHPRSFSLAVVLQNKSHHTAAPFLQSTIACALFICCFQSHADRFDPIRRSVAPPVETTVPPRCLLACNPSAMRCTEIGRLHCTIASHAFNCINIF